VEYCNVQEGGNSEKFVLNFELKDGKYYKNSNNIQRAAFRLKC